MSGQAKLYVDYLAQEGYHPAVHSSGQVLFKDADRTYVIEIDASDQQFVGISYPNFWSIDSDKEIGPVLVAANHANEKSKCAKVFLHEDRSNTSASIEMFLPQPEHFKEVFRSSLAALQRSVERFKMFMEL